MLVKWKWWRELLQGHWHDSHLQTLLQTRRKLVFEKQTPQQTPHLIGNLQPPINNFPLFLVVSILFIKIKTDLDE